MTNLEQAINIAVVNHTGQYDLCGIPEILHPLSVMKLVSPDVDAMIVGVLHDVVEDTSVTLKELQVVPFPTHIIEAVDAITRRKPEDETHRGYLYRVAANKLATKVKHADFYHNMSVDRIGPIPDIQKGKEMLKMFNKRYDLFIKILSEVSNHENSHDKPHPILDK